MALKFKVLKLTNKDQDEDHDLFDIYRVIPKRLKMVHV